MRSRDQGQFNVWFENAPISFSKENFSEIKQLFNRIYKQGVMNLMEYIDEQPDIT